LRLFVSVLAALVLSCPVIGNAQSAPSCQLPTDAKGIYELKDNPILAVSPTWSGSPAGMIPSGQPITVHVSFPSDLPAPTASQPAPTFAVSGKLGTTWQLYSVLSWQQATDNKRAGDLMLEAAQESGWGQVFPAVIKLVVAACNGGTLQFGRTTALVSPRVPSFIIAVVITAVLYFWGALSIKTSVQPRWKRLNPLWLAIDGGGQASLSQMQIIYFSVIVLFLVSYILLRTGILASLSNNVLLLLGIVGVGSVGGQLATNNTGRISFENWAWLQHKHWTTDKGFHVDKPSWNDLFSTNDVFDPYRFQIVSFSFVIGISLLMVGLSGLANFTIPESLLGVIGLSQATYIGGKIAAPATFSGLDAKLTDLRKAQADFLAATADKWVPLTDPKKTARRREGRQQSQVRCLPDIGRAGQGDVRRTFQSQGRTSPQPGTRSVDLRRGSHKMRDYGDSLLEASGLRRSYSTFSILTQRPSRKLCRDCSMRRRKR
jgi:hypothetical protein